MGYKQYLFIPHNNLYYYHSRFLNNITIGKLSCQFLPIDVEVLF